MTGILKKPLSLVLVQLASGMSTLVPRSQNPPHADTTSPNPQVPIRP